MGIVTVRRVLCAVLAATAVVAWRGDLDAAGPEPRGGVLDVRVESQRLSVRVSGTSLADVLEAIGRQASLKVVVNGDLSAPVTQSFTDLPLDDGIRRLMGGHSGVFIYGPAAEAPNDGKLSEVWVTAVSGTAPPAENASQPMRTSSGPTGEPSSALLSALKDRDASVRLHGAQAILREQGIQSVEVLREVVSSDPAPR